MPKGKYGTPATTIRRKDLKPRREQTDAQLLASAQRAAENWQKKLRRNLPTNPNI
jgi:hypothetical protein